MGAVRAPRQRGQSDPVNFDRLRAFRARLATLNAPNEFLISS
jgi:hypothetical protein